MQTIHALLYFVVSGCYCKYLDCRVAALLAMTSTRVEPAVMTGSSPSSENWSWMTGRKDGCVVISGLVCVSRKRYIVRRKQCGRGMGLYSLFPALNLCLVVDVFNF